MPRNPKTSRAKPYIKTFRCPDCGKEMYAPKRGGHRTRPGHLKWLYCPWCHKIQNMTQVE